MAAEGNTPMAGAAGYEGSQAPPAVSAEARIAMRRHLEQLIHDHGRGREERRSEALGQIQRAQEAQSLAPVAETASFGLDSSEPSAPSDASVNDAPSGKHFEADLVYKDESGGFELWLGSLEDALSLEGLRQRQINGVLNCALEECRRECAAFRGCSDDTFGGGGGGRRRTHARGASLANDGEAKANAAAKKRAMPLDVIRSLAEFNECWYSDFLDYDIEYYGLEALDQDGYRMSDHFEELQFFLERCRQEQRKVLVHCIMGINRSSFALIAFLCAGCGMRLQDAVALAARQRGFILSNGSFIDQLIERFGLEEAKMIEAR